MTAVRAADLAATRAGRTVLEDVDLQVEAGETVLLAGPSGSGKSSLLLALAGLLGSHPSTRVTGRVTVAGLDPRTAPARELAGRVGVLLQRPRDQLLALDVETEVGLALQRLGVPPGEVPTRVRALLDRVGAGDLVDRETATLSGGEAKRVALAQALAGDPDVLLLDEPLADLDAAGRRRLLDLLGDLAPDTAVVLAEHRLEAVRPLADRVLGLRDGALAPPPADEARPPTWDREPPDGPDLVVEDLAAAPGDAPVLEGLDVRLPPGLTGLAGPNGAGKTTLLRTVAGLLEPDEGLVRLGDRRLDGPAHERARMVGTCLQSPQAMFHRPTVDDEIAWGPRNLGTPCEPERVAADHGLAPLRERHPQTLSGGEAERLGWAAAHAHEPRVRLYDEPTTGLDPAARRVLAHRLAQARAGGHAVVATHDPWILRAADRVLRLEADGGARLEAPPAGARGRTSPGTAPAPGADGRPAP